MRKDASMSSTSAQAQQDLVSDGIEKFELPRSIVVKIAKAGVPDNVKLQKEAVLALLKGSTVFINYLAATAHDVALSKQHKSISASDVIRALEILQFKDMIDILQLELDTYRELAKTDKTKRGASNIVKSTPTGSATASAPANGKGKGVTAPAGGTTGASTPTSISAAPVAPASTSTPKPAATAKGKGKAKDMSGTNTTAASSASSTPQVQLSSLSISAGPGPMDVDDSDDARVGYAEEEEEEEEDDEE